MSNIVTTPAPRPRSTLVRNSAWGYAALITVMAVGQLFNFEDFIPAIGELQLPGMEAYAAVIAAIVVIAEVFALPFLLRMPLSPLMHWVSLACSVLVAIGWLKLSILAIMNDGVTVPLLGTKLELLLIEPSVALVLSLVMTAIALFIVHGMRPRGHKM
jgi:hypothetical protein